MPAHDGPAADPLMPREVGRASVLELSGADYLSIVVGRDEIEACDIDRTLSSLVPLLESKKMASAFIESVAIAFNGYNEVREELFEIPEVRDFVQALDQRFPYWLFFLDKRTSSLDAMWRCFMPPFLTPEAMAEDYPRRLGELLSNWWVPAMNAMCEFVGMHPQARNELTDRFVAYFQGNRDV